MTLVFSTENQGAPEGAVEFVTLLACCVFLLV